MSLTDAEIRERVAHIDSLLENVEAIVDSESRDIALSTVQALLDLYGEGLSRMIGHIAQECRGATQEDIADAFAGDELVSHLLVLHGLHPAGQLTVTHPEQPPLLVPLRRAHRSGASAEEQTASGVA